MYSLPITTYSDYWRATKLWSSYFGSLAMLAAGTRYSTLGAPADRTQTLQRPIQLTIQSSNTDELDSELNPLDFRQRAFSQSTVSRGSYQVSRGISRKSVAGQEVISQEPAALEAAGQEAVEQAVTGQEDDDQETAVQEEVSQEAAAQATTDQESVAQEAASPTAFGQEISEQTLENRITSITKVEEKEIPFDTQYIESDKLLPGMSQIQEEGEKGRLRQVVKTYEVGGQPIDQQVQSSFELKRAKKKVIIRNSKPVIGESFELAKLKISQTLQVEATAYTYTGNKTASGLVTRKGLIAVDPKVIPMGSKLYVEGYGYAIAADTGGDIRGNRIDVFFTTLRQCLDWGRRPVRIYVLKPN